MASFIHENPDAVYRWIVRIYVSAVKVPPNGMYIEIGSTEPDPEALTEEDIIQRTTFATEEEATREMNRLLRIIKENKSLQVIKDYCPFFDPDGIILDNGTYGQPVTPEDLTFDVIKTDVSGILLKSMW